MTNLITILYLLRKAKLHLLTLPRWFAAPIVLASIVLGGILAEADWVTILLASLAGVFVMAWAHGMNAFLDYSWTKLDQGAGRSKPKPYTTGQQPLGSGLATPKEVFFSALFWLLLSLIPVSLLSIWGSVWVWIPWSISSLCTFWYSWAKLHYHPEVPLMLGFGPIATLFSGSAVPGANLLQATLAGLPFGILFGCAAEAMDQYYDAEANWSKGLRSIGALAWCRSVPIALVVDAWILVAIMVHYLLTTVGILSAQSLLGVASAIVFALMSLLLNSTVESNVKLGIILGLFALVLYLALALAGQALYA